MQFPVPQFTDVEDRIIGPLTIKQFGILFGAGTLVFLSYTISGKNILVGLFFLVFVGLPAIGLAFVKINGRPLYNNLLYFLEFILSPKFLVFHKEADTLSSSVNLKEMKMQSELEDPNLKPKSKETTQDRLKEVQGLLAKQAEEERELAGRIR